MAGPRARSAWLGAALAIAAVYFFAWQQIAVDTAVPVLKSIADAADDAVDDDDDVDDDSQQESYYQRTLMRCNQSTFGAAERTPGTLAYKIKQADWCVVRARRMR